MVPNIASWDDLALAYEETDYSTGQHERTIFAAVDDDDTVYFGTSNLAKRNLCFDAVSSLLKPVPDKDIYPEWTTDKNGLTPLLEEVQTMEFLTQHPHPRIVRYHGCRVRRERIVGLVLDEHPHTLTDYIKNEIGTIDKEPFMDALASAIHHLHALGWAHNDVNPGNVLIDPSGLPVLIDFGSARPLGSKLGTSRGTDGWIDSSMKDYHTSEVKHDEYAINKIRAWLDAPIFD